MSRSLVTPHVLLDRCHQDDLAVRAAGAGMAPSTLAPSSKSGPEKVWDKAEMTNLERIVH